MIKFYFQFVKEYLAWHLRLSRSKPGKWRWGKIWSVERTYDKDRWILTKEIPAAHFKRVDGPLSVEITYSQAGVSAAGKGDYFFELPEGYKVKPKYKRKTKKKKSRKK